MRTFSFYHKETGAIHSTRVATSEVDAQALAEFVAINTPADHLPVLGSLDPSKHWVDPATGEVSGS